MKESEARDKANLRKLRGTERRYEFAVWSVQILTLVPILCAIALLAASLLPHLSTSWRDATNAYRGSLNDLVFVAFTYVLTAIFHFMLALFSYAFLLNKARQGNLIFPAVRLLTRLGTGLPVALISFSIIWPLKHLGIGDFILAHAISLSMVFAIALLPTSTFLMSDVAPMVRQAQERLFEAGYHSGLPRLLFIFHIVIPNRNTVVYIANVSLFTSFRVIAELGFLKTILKEGQNSTLQQFVQNFYGTFRPEDLATLGITFFIVAIIGLFVALVTR